MPPYVDPKDEMVGREIQKGFQNLGGQPGEKAYLGLYLIFFVLFLLCESVDDQPISWFIWVLWILLTVFVVYKYIQEYNIPRPKEYEEPGIFLKNFPTGMYITVVKPDLSVKKIFVKYEKLSSFLLKEIPEVYGNNNTILQDACAFQESFEKKLQEKNYYMSMEDIRNIFKDAKQKEKKSTTTNPLSETE